MFGATGFELVEAPGAPPAVWSGPVGYSLARRFEQPAASLSFCCTPPLSSVDVSIVMERGCQEMTVSSMVRFEFDHTSMTMSVVAVDQASGQVAPNILTSTCFPTFHAVSTDYLPKE